VEPTADFVQELLDVYQNDTDPGIHAASEWSLRQFGQHDQLARLDQQLVTGQYRGDRQWFVAPHGHTMVVIPGPTQYFMGSPKTESDRGLNEPLHVVHIRHSFSIACKETTVEQFQRFIRDNPQSWPDGIAAINTLPGIPQAMVSWYHAAAYCNWLSKQEGIPETDWCYESDEEGQYGPGMTIKANASELRGYLLPSEVEWEYACRAGAATPWFFGRADAFLNEYAASAENTSHPLEVGLHKPNDFGLFDTLGNLSEWCQDLYYPTPPTTQPRPPGQHGPDPVAENSQRLVRGGSFEDGASRLRCAARAGYAPGTRSSSIGFRVARNYP
jgi:formylglycine-generating enzyme required for sulfatase activity